MDSKIKAKSKQVSPAQPRKRPNKVSQAKPVLPSWVIGAYDGPKNSELSLKEGYDS